MGQSSSSSVSNVSNTTSTTTTTLANSFNNALNTTQNFSNIGGLAPEGGSTFGSTSYSLIIMIIAGLLAFFIIFKGKK